MIFRIGILVVLSLLISSCTSILSDPHQAELQAAYERSRVISSEARMSLDTSKLSEAFTQNSITAIEKVLEQEKNLTTFIGEEKEVDWVEVVAYNPPEAIITVKYFYRGFTYNRETGEIKYGNAPPRRYWRIEEYRMVQENGIWKFDKFVDLVDWSG